MCWAGDIAMDEVLAAADRLRRTRGGQDLAAWGEPEPKATGASARLDKSRPTRDTPAHSEAAGGRSGGHPPTQDPPDADSLTEDLRSGDELAEDELRAAEAGACPPMSSPEIAGHVRIEPGPALAGWLGQAQPGQLDEAGLVNSITGWRKVTSWAQAQELAAVAELGRRRGVMDDPELERDPARELSAEFAPN